MGLALLQDYESPGVAGLRFLYLDRTEIKANSLIYTDDGLTVEYACEAFHDSYTEEPV